MRSSVVLLLVLLVGWALAPAPATAQHPIGLSALLPVASPNVTGTRGLAFGVITPGAADATVAIPAGPAPVSATVHSGEFLLDVGTNRGVAFELSMPAQLTDGDRSLDVLSEGTQYGGWCLTGAAACDLAAFDPSAGSVLACARALGNGSCHPNRTWPPGSRIGVYVGAQLVVPADARAGTFTGTITLTVTQVH